MALHKIRFLRRLLLPVFKRLNPGDITIKHHWSGDPVRLHSFLHKDYWYTGRNRERDLMERFGQLVSPGDQVIEVGGHIGYIALYFARLVGPQGHVYVFEPGANNLPYARRNLQGKPNITLIEKGAGSENSRLTFYLEDHTGQMNSFVTEDRRKFPTKESHFTEVQVDAVEVEVVTLDSCMDVYGARPNFIKIDVEGYEWPVLQGARRILAECQPMVMVEVQLDREPLFELLLQNGYCVFGVDGRPILSTEDFVKPLDNVFALHATRHAAAIERFTLRAV